MKKLLLTIIYITLICLFFGCENEELPYQKENDKFNFSENIDKITIQKDYYFNAIINKYNPYVIEKEEDVKKIVSSLNSIEFEENNNVDFDLNSYIFRITISNLNISLLSNEYFLIQDDVKIIQCKLLKNDFSFIYNLEYERNPLYMDFLELLDNYKITVKNDKNVKVDITNTSEFLKRLKLISYTKSSEDLTKETVKYIINLDNIQINIIDENRFLYNNESYNVIINNFEFLNTIEFKASEDVELPWI